MECIIKRSFPIDRNQRKMIYMPFIGSKWYNNYHKLVVSVNILSWNILLPSGIIVGERCTWPYYSSRYIFFCPFMRQVFPNGGYKILCIFGTQQLISPWHLWISGLIHLKTASKLTFVKKIELSSHRLEVALDDGLTIEFFFLCRLEREMTIWDWRVLEINKLPD